MKIKASQLRRIIKEELHEVSLEKTGAAKAIDKFGTAALGVGVTVGSLVGTPALGAQSVPLVSWLEMRLIKSGKKPTWKVLSLLRSYWYRLCQDILAI